MADMKFKVGDLVRIHKEKWDRNRGFGWIKSMDKTDGKVYRIFNYNKIMKFYELADCKNGVVDYHAWVESCLEKIPKEEEIAWLI